MALTRIQITEVGPRDGLQNLPEATDIAFRTWLIEQLAETGLRRIEAGSFVSARAVPAMVGSDEVFENLQRTPGTSYMALVPNRRGAEAAISCRADRLALFTAASESFCQRNTGCSIEQSLERFAAVFSLANQKTIPVRAYISCVSGCPYEGDVSMHQVAELARLLHQMGADEVCLADTTGVGNPEHTRKLVQLVAQQVPVEQLALHMHDTYGSGLLNCWAGYLEGVRSFDSSIAGLGGCPYAPGASGNLATEDLVHLLHRMGLETGVDLSALTRLGNQACQRLGLKNASRVGLALAKSSSNYAPG